MSAGPHPETVTALDVQGREPHADGKCCQEGQEDEEGGREDRDARHDPIEEHHPDQDEAGD
jgi:hypothetical protein